ncbi:hypothetical protein D3C86_2076220 [compost metagenome]
MPVTITLLKSTPTDIAEGFVFLSAATEVNAVDKKIAVKAEANNVFTEVFMFLGF